MEQLSLEFERVTVNVKDVLLVQIDKSGFRFMNEAGFETEHPPEGSYVESNPAESQWV